MRALHTIALLFAAWTAAFAGTPTRIERKLEHAGYIDVGTSIPGLHVDMMYARQDNFTGSVLYDSLTRAYLHPDAARALARAQAELSRRRKGTFLLVKDAARPVSVQRRMFDTVRGTPHSAYVANPRRGGGTHNFGIAVDVTLCDSLGQELPMGTPVDFFGAAAHITDENTLVAQGRITAKELQNRRLLRGVMTAAGFKTIRKEWWHFELQRREVAARRYSLIDF